MALTLDSNDEVGSTSVQEVLEYAHHNVSARDFDSLVAAAPLLRGLAQDRRLVVDRIEDSIKALLDGRRASFYTAQSFVLGSLGHTLVRGNLWCPTGSNATARTPRDALFSYYMPHDHNYNFLTVGYFGPGYRTRIYDIDPDDFEGSLGETVPIRFLEDTFLPQHKAMAYRAYRDLHTQLPPSSLSISLNLMVRDDATAVEEQYTFDISDDGQTAKITAYPDASPVSVRVGLVQLAGQIGGNGICNILESVATGRAMPPRLRREAIWALSQRDDYDPEFLARLSCQSGLELPSLATSGQL